VQLIQFLVEGFFGGGGRIDGRCRRGYGGVLFKTLNLRLGQQTVNLIAGQLRQEIVGVDRRAVGRLR
jgi:hypothetical protein